MKSCSQIFSKSNFPDFGKMIKTWPIFLFPILAKPKNTFPDFGKAFPILAKKFKILPTLPTLCPPGWAENRTLLPKMGKFKDEKWPKKPKKWLFFPILAKN